MVGSSKDVLIIGGILGIVYIAYRGIGGLTNQLSKLKLPDIKIPELPIQNIHVPTPQNFIDEIPKISYNIPVAYAQGEDGKVYVNGVLQPSNVIQPPKEQTVIQVVPASLDIHSQILSVLTPKSSSSSSSSGTVASNAIVQTTETAAKKNIPIPTIPYQSNTLTKAGGSGFIGGKTTYGDNLVDTLGEVLKIFPNISASRARDVLSQNQGLTPEAFMKINLSNVRNITGDLKQKQIFGNSSNPAFNGQTPQQISEALMRHYA